MNMFHFKKFEMPPAQHLMPYLFGDLNVMKKTISKIFIVITIFIEEI